MEKRIRPAELFFLAFTATLLFSLAAKSKSKTMYNEKPKPEDHRDKIKKQQNPNAK